MSSGAPQPFNRSLALRWLVAAVVVEAICLTFDIPRSEWLRSNPAHPLPVWLQFHGLRGFGTGRGDGGWTIALLDFPPFSRWVPILLVGAALAAGVGWLERWCSRRPGATRTALSLTALAFLGYAFELAGFYLRDERLGQGLYERATWNNYSGYLNAAIGIQKSSQLFAGYLGWMSTPQGCFHCLSHPPGPIVYYRVILKLIEQLPAGWLAPLSRGLAAAFHIQIGPYQPTGVLAAILGINGILLLAALIVVPAYGLAELLTGHPSLRLSALGLLIPGVSIMSVHFDQVYAALCTALLYFLVLALTRAPQGLRWGFAAGLVWGLALFFSVAFFTLLAPVVYLGLAAALGVLGADSIRPSVKNLLRVWVGVATGLLAFFLGLWLATGFDAPAVFHHITSEGAVMVGAVERPYWAWLFYNLVQFAQFLGLPLFAYCVLTLLEPAPEPATTAAAKGLDRWARWLRERFNVLALFFFATILFLDVTGKSRGEVGRIWALLMPLSLPAFYLGVRRRGGALWLDGLLASQFLVCVLIAARWFP